MRPLLLSALLLLPMTGFTADPEVLGAVRDSYPHLSPDGQLVVFQSNRSGSNQLWRMNADGSDVLRLTEFTGNGAETPQWSPDGQRVLFAAYVGDGNNEVFTMNADGSGVRQLTDSAGYDGHPHWTADGSHIVFNSDRDTPNPDAPWGERHHDIWRMAADGSGAERLSDCQGVCTYGSLSPDGRHLLYRHSFAEPGLNWNLESTDHNSEIVVLDLNNRQVSRIAPHPAFDGWPRWSSDGTRVVFASNRTGPPRFGQLWTVGPDGSDLQALTSGDWAHVQPAFSFDGEKILTFRFQEYPDTEYGGIAVVTLQD